jgi:hypothetical protein
MHGDQVINELSFRRPKLKHMKMSDGAKGNFDLMSKLLVAICDIPPFIVDELDPADFDEVGKIIESFFPKPLET